MSDNYDDIEYIEPKSYEKTFEYREDYIISIRRDYLGDDIVISLNHKETTDTTSQITLRQIEAKGYFEGDYFQQTFTSSPKRKGLGSILHDFLIEKIPQLDLGVQNIYSTNFDEDEYRLSDDARNFWERRVELRAAQYLTDKQRYKFVWV